MSRIDPFTPLTPAVRMQSLAKTMAGRTGDVWVFGYGSLMWKADPSVTDTCRATIFGYRRSFCVWTLHARGTPDKPGLGLGLTHDRKGRCDGLAMRFAGEDMDAALERIWTREMWTDIYAPVWRNLTTARGPLKAIVFEVDTASRQFAENLSLTEKARLIACAQGAFGTCRDYLNRTIAAFRENDIDSSELTLLSEMVTELVNAE